MVAYRPSTDEIWIWLDQVPDPEIPAVSVVDLGIVRDLHWEEEELVVTITPTYSGCPATNMIMADIERTLVERGIERLRLETRLSPPWSTDWLSDKGRQQLRQYGIAPPTQNAIDVSRIDRRSQKHTPISCPHCGSTNTRLSSPFGSTACKALYKCDECLEPFDYFKPH